MSSKCGICENGIISEDCDSTLKCSGVCDQFVHKRCAQSDLYGRKSPLNRFWKCKKCQNLSLENSSGCCSPTTVLKKDFLIQLLDEVKKEVEELKVVNTETTERSTMMKGMSTKVNESVLIMEEIKVELATLKQMNEDLRDKYTNLSNQVVYVKDRLRHFEQCSRNNTLQIAGIPATRQENLFTMLKGIAATLGVAIEEKDVSNIYRVKAMRKDRLPTIIVQFVNKYTRDALIREFRETNNLFACNVNPVLPKKRVFINEYMTAESRLFLSELRDRCQDVGYGYAWFRDGKFFVRKCQGSKCIRVDSYNDIYNLK